MGVGRKMLLVTGGAGFIGSNFVLDAVRLLGRGPLSTSLRLAWNERQGLRMALSS